MNITTNTTATGSTLYDLSESLPAEATQAEAEALLPKLRERLQEEMGRRGDRPARAPVEWWSRRSKKDGWTVRIYAEGQTPVKEAK